MSSILFIFLQMSIVCAGVYVRVWIYGLCDNRSGECGCMCILVFADVCVCVPDWPQGPEPSRFMRYGKVRAKHLLTQRKALVWGSCCLLAAKTHPVSYTQNFFQKTK